MQTLHWADHIVVAIFAVGIGINGYLHIGEFLRKVAAGDPHVRRSEYRWTMLIQWVVTAAALFVWFGLADGRTLDDLGLGWNSHWHSWLGVGLTVAACSFFALQLFLARSNDEARSSLREQFDPASQMLPHTAAEVRLFAGVALTAGVCEEILFRGYLLAYLEFFMPTWLAATLAVLAFGLAHSYLVVLTKGPGNTIRTVVFGAVAMALYLLTGSLWCSIALHIAMDLLIAGFAHLLYVAHPIEDSAKAN